MTISFILYFCWRGHSWSAKWKPQFRNWCLMGRRDSMRADMIPLHECVYIWIKVGMGVQSNLSSSTFFWRMFTIQIKYPNIGERQAYRKGNTNSYIIHNTTMLSWKMSYSGLWLKYLSYMPYLIPMSVSHVPKLAPGAVYKYAATKDMRGTSGSS